MYVKKLFLGKYVIIIWSWKIEFIKYNLVDNIIFLCIFVYCKLNMIKISLNSLFSSFLHSFQANKKKNRKYLRTSENIRVYHSFNFRKRIDARKYGKSNKFVDFCYSKFLAPIKQNFAKKNLCWCYFFILYQYPLINQYTKQSHHCLEIILSFGFLFA